MSAGPAAKPETSGTDPRDETESLLEVRDLRTWFRTEARASGRGADGPAEEARAVDGVSFRLAAGDTLGLVGESGCGKSVTALSILRLVPSPPGRTLPGSSVRLRGVELLDLPEAEMRKVRGGEIAMIFQEPMTSLNPVLTIGEQIAEAIRLHLGGARRAVREQVIALLDRVGIPDPSRRYSDYPHRLSGGQRQRVMIAMALSCRPALLIADEPTTALDVTIQAEILELLRSLQEEFAMALLLITHDFGVVAEIADRIAVMYAGQIVEEGATAAVLDAPAHPYTEGLLRSVPDLERPAGRLAPIPGVVPQPTEWPPACRFEPRCPHAWGLCAREAPPPLPRAGGETRAPEREWARCWLLSHDASHTGTPR